MASTLELSLAQLGSEERQRFDELAVFPEDVDIPLATVAALWRRTGGLDEFDTEARCERLARLSLLLALELSTRVVRMHDVVRRFLLDRLAGGASELHRTMVEALRPVGGWWTLPPSEPYTWTQLFHHLDAAGMQDELLATAMDLQWLSTKTSLRTAFTVEADLRLAQESFPKHTALKTLGKIYSQSVHLFGDCQTPAEIRATLLARLPVRSGIDGGCEARLVPITKLPDAPHPALVRTLGSRRGAVRACAISVDGSLVATASTDRKVTVWNTDTGKEVLQVAISLDRTRARSDVRALGMSADGGRLAAATGDRRLWVWDLATGTVLAHLSGHTDEVTDCSLSADGRWLLSASRDEKLKLWDVETGEIVHTLARAWAEDIRGWLTPTNEQGHWAAVLGCAMGADGRMAASASADQTVIVWDLDSGQALAVLQGHTAAVNSCAISPDGRRVASVDSDGTLRIWEWATREHTAVVAHRSAAVACGFSEDGGYVATASADGIVRVWAADGPQLLQTLTGHAGQVNDCVLSSTASLIVSAGNDGTARLWRLGLMADPYSPRQHEGFVLTCASAPDGRHAFTAGEDPSVILWDLPRGKARLSWDAQPSGVRACAVSPDGSRVATASKDRSVAIWAAATGERLAVLSGHRDFVNGCAFSADGRLLASVSNDRTVRLWDLSTRSRKLAWQAHRQWINTCAFSPCGRWLVSASSDGTLKRWNLTVDEALWEAWLTDPRPLQDERAEQLLSARDHAGHGASVNHCAFTPDGQLVISASSDHTLRVWDAASGAERRVFTGHLDDVNGFGVSPDGQRVASVAGDGGMIVWSLPEGVHLMALHVDGPLSMCTWVGAERVIAVGARGVYLFDIRG